MFKPSIPDISVQQAVEQISLERINESRYLNLEAYFSKWNLDGFKAIMRRQADGEAKHARKIIDFLDERNADYRVNTLPLEPMVFITFGEVLTAWLDAEQKTTAAIALRFNTTWDYDPLAKDFWMDMLKEQREEEKQPMYWITRAEELGIMDLNLDSFDIGNPIEFIKRQSLIILDNEAKEESEAG